MKGLTSGIGRIGERLDDLAGFEKGAWPALNEEKRNRIGARGRLMGVMQDLRTVIRDIDLDLELIEFGIDAGLANHQRSG